MKNRISVINVGIILLGALLFITGNGSSRLFDWDEINFAESAREMVTTGDWFNVRINFESFWEKPPLFIWMQALSMKLFGVNEFAARFPNAIMGILTLLLLFNIGRKAKDERFGLLWMMMYAISFLPFLYFKSGIIDPWFNFFIFCGIYFFSRYADPAATDRKAGNAALSAASIGLGILTKGPVALLVFGLTFIVWILYRTLAGTEGSVFRFDFRWKDVALWVAVLCLVGGSWFIMLALTGHSQVIDDFITYQIRLFQTKDAGHGGFLLYHFVILFFGVIPASIFALGCFRKGILKTESNPEMADLFRWMMTAFWVVLILFTIVRTKIVHYSSFCYFPLTFLAAYASDRMLDGRMKFRKYQSVLLIGIASIFGLAITILTLFDHIKEYIIPYIQDPFAVSCMDAESDWIGFEPLLGIMLIATTAVFCIKFRKSRKLKHFIILASGNLVFLFCTLLLAVGEIEKYSQASAVEFFISRQGEDCYVCPTYYKSYAQYFYTDRQPDNTCEDFDFLRTAELDKNCYFVLKDIPEDRERFEQDVPDAIFLEMKSGFLFYMREKADQAEYQSCTDEQKSEIE